MVDPLSVLGAAVGVTSLIMQLTDECVKGYKLYQEAADLPQTHRYLLVRLHIEQQRFLNFAFETGLLNVDGIVCSTLQVNKSLLLAILAEIKLLFESFATVNGKYEKVVAHSPVNWTDHSYAEHDLMSFLCIVMSDHTQLERENKRAETAKRVRGLGKSIAQAAKNLRTIVVEPKRLIWAAVDKDAFEQLILKLDGFNTFLISLLDSSQLRRLQDSMSTAYMEILQLRNDVGDLTALVKALSPAAETKSNNPATTLILEGGALSQAVAEQTAIQKKKESYLRHLASIKIQFNKINSLSNSTVAISDYRKFIDSPLSLGDFGFVDVAPEAGTRQHRTRTTYRGRRVWIEWKDIPATGPIAVVENVEWRTGLLTDLLRSAKPEGFRAAQCLGYIKILHTDDATQFGIVFEETLIHGTESKIATLQDLLEGQPYPSLSARLALCTVLARCVHSLHAVNWLHKALRPDNIIFFSSSGLPSLNEPFLSGFELSRPSIMDQLTEKPKFDPLKDIYRHPNAQSSQTDGKYRKSYDIYSLGVLMIEIALWKQIKDIVPLEDLAKAKPSALRKIQPWLLGTPLDTGFPLNTTASGSCLQQVAFACGDSFHDIVEQCLRMDIIERPEYSGEKEVATALRVHRATEQEIVKKLDGLTDIDVLLDGLPVPIDLHLDAAGQNLYWTDRGDPPRGNTVNTLALDHGMANTRAPFKERILTRKLHEGIGLAIDEANDMMYFTDLAGGVYSARLDGTGKKTLHEDVRDCTGIAFVPAR
ncbi:hypothetical protein BP6252_08787 [Coleophoma cylindrospora]|uniref:Protein kinase domain-containing protein n=1 Tax=Coleophoma cylindrospora TaxID=1849047 RepID=A0A3D8R6Z1_9HELO|nr:hypothetical protein BP6252_08787 [Coleophoma cylindrospora]